MTPDRNPVGESCPGAIPVHNSGKTNVGAQFSVIGLARLPFGIARESEGCDLQKYLLIAMGGALGSMARYWVGATIGSRMGVRFPYGTLAVNLTACLVIGFTITWLGERVEFNPAWRFLIAVGFVGAYSTFSTYEWETLATLRSGAFAMAALYSLGSVILGLGATWCGAALAEIL
jgi:CrcB protein